MRAVHVVSLICVVGLFPVAVSAEPATRPSLTDNVLDAKGLDYAIEKLKAPMRESDPLPAAEELKRFKPQKGLAVDLVAAEPDIRQPLCINFDERGRMWVVQYIQYPFPAGLKVVEYDQYIRAKFDKTPAPPPKQFPGKDVVTILEDVDHDGSFRKHKTFVSGLSICTSALPGRGGRGPDDYGVWVMNAPYLLFYPDKNRDDIPDGDPIVHLSGFGLEDTHAVANSLTWGPDGWLYGCQGSTCTAKIKTELGDTTKTTDFLGQAIWRYHPETHRFEIFAEGGGNTFGLEFDDHGNAFSGTNWGKYRGLHFVQGGYYVKGWGKHGPLTNPYAFGYFEHMPHTGNADRLSHTFVVYGGGLLGPEYTGKTLSPNSLQSRLQVSRLEPDGSTFKTVEEPYLMTSDDGWFRPVDLKAGPDGALYVADFYEKRISHVDPRDTWDRSSGRIWRVRPADWKPGLPAMDLWTEPAEKLVERLKSPNRWERAMARRVLTDRGATVGKDAIGQCSEILKSRHGPAVLESLWVLHALGKLENAQLLKAMSHPEPQIRTWAVRLAGDHQPANPDDLIWDRLGEMASKENNPQVRSQLASTARRLKTELASALALAMMDAAKPADVSDPHIPMLVWWAIQPELDFEPGNLNLLLSNALDKSPLRDQVFPRIARRLIADPTPGNQYLLLVLSRAHKSDECKKLLVQGIKQGLVGRKPPELRADLLQMIQGEDLELSVILGNADALEKAIARITDEGSDKAERVALIPAVADAGSQSAGKLVKIATTTKIKEVRLAAITALAKADAPSVATELLSAFPRWAKEPATTKAIIATLLTRQAWASELLRAVQAGVVPKAELSAPDLERIRQFDDPLVVALVEKVLGKTVRASGPEKLAEVARVARLVTTGYGDPAAGKILFTTRCAACHTLFEQGGKVGPDLTGYDRRNVNDMVTNIVDPSAYIREEFASFRVKTRGGEIYIGLITERSADRLTLIDAGQQKTTLAKSDIADERALAVSLMPEGLLAGLSDQEVRDLFKYLASTGK